MRISALLVTMLVLAGCSTTKIESQPGPAFSAGYRPGRILVATSVFPSDERAPIETTLVEAFRSAGFQATPGFELKALAFSQPGVDLVRDTARTESFDTLLLISSRQIHTEHGMSVIPTYGSYGYTVATFRTESTRFLVNLYDVSTMTVVWSASAENNRGKAVTPAGFAEELTTTLLGKLKADGIDLRKR